jgi:FlaA1/EpsC-like NDP-sugar epimerase
MGSRGSVIPFFIEKKREGMLPITHEEMTRFNISLQDGVDLVMFALANHLGGEIFIPKIPSYKILDIAEAIAPECERKVVGIRPGEKLHEEMITDTDSLNTIDLGDLYAILPSVSYTYTEADYMAHHKAEKVAFGFEYNSGTNTEWETVDSLRALIKQHVDADFEV